MANETAYNKHLVWRQSDPKSWSANFHEMLHTSKPGVICQVCDYAATKAAATSLSGESRVRLEARALVSARQNLQGGQGQLPFSTHFLSIGTGAFLGAASRIGREAQSTGMFDMVQVLTETTFSPRVMEDPRFTWHRSQRRGGGFWWYKPASTLDYVKTSMNDGDLLVYADAGCELGDTEEALLELAMIMNRLRADADDAVDVVAVGLTTAGRDIHPENRWTKSSVFAHFEGDPYHPSANTTQIMSSVWGMRSVHCRVRWNGGLVER